MKLNEAYSTVVQSHQQAPSNNNVPLYEIIGSSTIDTKTNECYSTAGIELWNIIVHNYSFLFR